MLTMFHSKSIIVVLMIIPVFFCSIVHAEKWHRIRSRRDIGGESLDTSNFVLTIDTNGTRFVEVPREYMINWLDDQIMWRTVRRTLSLLLFLFLQSSGQLS